MKEEENRKALRISKRMQIISHLGQWFEFATNCH